MDRKPRRADSSMSDPVPKRQRTETPGTEGGGGEAPNWDAFLSVMTKNHSDPDVLRGENLVEPWDQKRGQKGKRAADYDPVFDGIDEQEEMPYEQFRFAKKQLGSEEKPGVVLLTTIPHMMTPPQLKSVLSQYGEVTNMMMKSKTVRRGRRRTRYYSNAWVQFRNKKDAKMVALVLNGMPIQANRKKSYSGELWTMKYLKGLNWEKLIDEKITKRLKKETVLKQEREFLFRRDLQFRRNVFAAKEQQGVVDTDPTIDALRNQHLKPGSAGKRQIRRLAKQEKQAAALAAATAKQEAAFST